MDITSYLLGKNASGGGGGGGLEEYIYTTPPTSANLISKIVKKLPTLDLSNVNNFNFQYGSYLEEIEGITGTSSRTSCASMFYECLRLRTVPLFDTSNVTDMSYMFYNCTNLESIPKFDTSKVTNMSEFLYTSYYEGQYGYYLTDLPLLDTSKVTNFSGMLYGRKHLSDQSLDNVLQMCVNATSFTGQKKLGSLGIYGSSGYSVQKIQALPHYQDFIDAGWSIGY